MDPVNGRSTPFWTSCERQRPSDFIPGTVVIQCALTNRCSRVAEKASGTPSQLISRRRSGNVPPTPLLGPKKFLKASTAVWISAGVAPDASNTSGSAEAATGLRMRVKPKVAIASGMRRRAPRQGDRPIDFLKCRVVIVFVFICFVEVGLLNLHSLQSSSARNREHPHEAL